MNEAVLYLEKSLKGYPRIGRVEVLKSATLPFYIKQSYKLYGLSIFNREIALAEYLPEMDFSINQAVVHLDVIRQAINRLPVLFLHHISAINRSRLIEKGVDFIVPGKQLYLPSLLVNITEQYNEPKKVSEHSLLPSAQCMVLYHLLHCNNPSSFQIDNANFKTIATELNYSAMAITDAVKNLKELDVIEVVGDKEKRIHFNRAANELWQYLLDNRLLINPVAKTIYSDNKPNEFMPKSNISALAAYTEINEGSQSYFAISKQQYELMKKGNEFENENSYEGQFCIEVWKYNPAIIIEGLAEMREVDPLSLYLSMQGNADERIAYETEQLIQNYIW